MSETLFVLGCQDFELYIKLRADDWFDKIMENTEMVQESNKEEKKGTKSLCSSKNSIENSKNSEINKLFDNNLKGLMNDLIRREIAKEFDAHIWIQSEEGGRSSKLNCCLLEDNDN